MIDYAVLKQDIQANADCAPFIADGNDQAISDLYNAVVPTNLIPFVTKSARQLLWDFATEVLELQLIEDPKLYRYWQGWVEWMRAWGDNDLDISSAQVQQVITALQQVQIIPMGGTTAVPVLRERTVMIGDTPVDLTVAAQLDRVLRRAGSRAETLFGADTVLVNSDVSQALGR